MPRRGSGIHSKYLKPNSSAKFLLHTFIFLINGASPCFNSPHNFPSLFPHSPFLIAVSNVELCVSCSLVQLPCSKVFYFTLHQENWFCHYVHSCKELFTMKTSRKNSQEQTMTKAKHTPHTHEGYLKMVLRVSRELRTQQLQANVNSIVKYLQSERLRIRRLRRLIRHITR